MDFTSGKEALLQAMALLKDENDLSSKISDLLSTVYKDKSCTISSICEVLALQNQEADKKKKVADLLQEVSMWWGLLVEDREKLLLTISKIELEKEAILKKQKDPKEIYGHIMDDSSLSIQAPPKKMPRFSGAIKGIQTTAADISFLSGQTYTPPRKGMQFDDDEDDDDDDFIQKKMNTTS